MANLNEDLMEACKDGNLEAAEKAIDNGANVKYKNKQGRTPLFNASAYGYPEILEMLLSKGANSNNNINDKDMFDYSPLFSACKNVNTKVVEILINNGADVNDKNTDGHTPLYIASLWGRADIAKMLMEEGAKVNEKTEFGKTPFSIAKNQEIKELIIDNEKEKWEDMFEKRENPTDFEEIEYIDDELNELYDEFKATKLALSINAMLGHKFNYQDYDFNRQLLETLGEEFKKKAKGVKKTKRFIKRKSNKSKKNKRRNSRKSRKSRK